jgi:alpha-beta hydrolase superfamily lysophospholipase
MEETHLLSGKGDHEIRLRIWRPEGDISGVVQLLHGMGEYIDRYERFAHAANQRGIVVCAHNHRGHGGPEPEAVFFADRGGWNLLVDDAHIVHEHVRVQFPDKRIVLLGHSMGSFVAQSFAMHYGAKLSGLLLSGSTWPSRLQAVPGILLARLEALRIGKRGTSTLLDKLGFGNFNKCFKPARTELDWLSRDEKEVDAYVADPLCGGPYTCGLWIDLLGGLFSIGSDHALSRIPGDLPILITGGSDDPVGGERGMTKLAMHYAQTGHSRMTLKLYEGGRHEMLNETNRDEVTRDWLDWISARLWVAGAR